MCCISKKRDKIKYLEILKYVLVREQEALVVTKHSCFIAT